MIRTKHLSYLIKFATQTVSLILIAWCCLVHMDLYAKGIERDQVLADSSQLNKKRLALVVGAEAAFYTAGILYLSEIWYADDESVPFHFYKDQKGWLQMDKFAHSYVAYYESYVGYHALRWSGVSKKKAIWLGGTLGFVLQLPVEIFDGLYEGYGFSVSDVAANAVGSGLFMVQQNYWDEQRIIPKFSFAPSSYAEIRPGTLGETFGEQLVQDYNAQTYWFSTSPSSFFKNSNWPQWLCLSLGYSGAGMLSEFDNPRFANGIPVEDIERYRQYYLSIDLDLTKIKTNSKFLKTAFKLLNILKIPAPAIEFNRMNGVEFHPIYY